MLFSKNIILRPFTNDDAKYIAELRLDFIATRAFAGSPFPSNINSEKEWISLMYPKGIRDQIYFAIEEKKTKEFIGYCVARSIDYINRNANVGIILAKKGRGKGYFKEISILFYDYLFNQINLHKLYSIVIEDNQIAFNTDKKIGFKLEGEIKEHIWQDGKYKNVMFVSLYAKDFFKMQQLMNKKIK